MCLITPIYVIHNTTFVDTNNLSPSKLAFNCSIYICYIESLCELLMEFSPYKLFPNLYAVFVLCIFVWLALILILITLLYANDSLCNLDPEGRILYLIKFVYW